MDVIALSNLHYRWAGQSRDTLALAELRVRKGEHLFIRGASGSGKTTLLNLLAGILTPASGSLTILGQGLQAMGSAARDRFRADHMGVIFQQFNLLPYLSVLENVQLPCEFSARRKQRAGKVQASARRLLDHLGLATSLQQRAVTGLSVGQQQRVAVARALIGSPEILIADEPTSALDTDTRDGFLQLLFQEAEAQGSTIVFVSHDPHIAGHFPRVVDLGELNQA
ncbi:MAG TPA: ABC transporter ATP-binding protein [Candidatus Thiothrix moscowensis]|uniref:ABC transporter ATP-binding protein n=1 Tax=unclassified Thiothrix TaxID=2636184 RepID=UPI0025E3EECA|nr:MULTISPECIES: ABC transporter ATP-binding protein [unclassified Thiothrix]HRJ52363.1 ABC transporter ATP-binding protein [Candidatus Thiothrix moscowensis]HRJ92678.1 ABC transporter ATP-binding protein [Candidatus Thiothrix moscowensis]